MATLDSKTLERYDSEIAEGVSQENLSQNPRRTPLSRKPSQRLRQQQ